MSDLISTSDPGINEAKGWFDLKLLKLDGARKEVPDFEYRERSVVHLHALASTYQARTHVATILQEFKILQSAGLSHENLSQTAVTSAQVLANVTNMLNIRVADFFLTSFFVVMGDFYLRKADMHEKPPKTSPFRHGHADTCDKQTRATKSRATYHLGCNNFGL
ncbi:hypothetical protein AMTRI_Chr04g251280 [Amborella trichopoda]